MPFITPFHLNSAHIGNAHLQLAPTAHALGPPSLGPCLKLRGTLFWGLRSCSSSNLQRQQETRASGPMPHPFLYTYSRGVNYVPVCWPFLLACLSLPTLSLLFTGIGSQITLCTQSLTETLLSGEPRPRQMSQPWWWQTKKYWQDLEYAFPLMPKMLNK